jgi:hypothetical protein
MNTYKKYCLRTHVAKFSYFRKSTYDAPIKVFSNFSCTLTAYKRKKISLMYANNDLGYKAIFQNFNTLCSFLMPFSSCPLLHLIPHTPVTLTIFRIHSIYENIYILYVYSATGRMITKTCNNTFIIV